MVPRCRATRVSCPLVTGLELFVLIELERLIARWLAPTTRAGSAPAVREVSSFLRRRRSFIPRWTSLLNRVNSVNRFSSLFPSRLGRGGREGESVLVSWSLQGATIGGRSFRMAC